MWPADPIVRGASFQRYSRIAEIKVYIDEVGIQEQTPAGLFRCVKPEHVNRLFLLTERFAQSIGKSAEAEYAVYLFIA